MIDSRLGKVAPLLAFFAMEGTALAASPEWPPLPSQGFITGRAAHQDDVKNGNAVFVAAVNNVVIGKPLPIPIPQYAWEHDTHTRVILVQAEEANGIKLFGVRGLDGKEAVVTETDLELLGTLMPTK
jgi:hypothetical protein